MIKFKNLLPPGRNSIPYYKFSPPGRGTKGVGIDV